MEGYTCQFCGTTQSKNGKPFTNKGSLAIHEYHCKMRKPGTDKKPEKEECECGEGKWRFLSPLNSTEKKAMDAGYSEVCDACLSLRK